MSTSKICINSNCKTELSVSAKFCSDCGTQQKRLRCSEGDHGEGSGEPQKRPRVSEAGDYGEEKEKKQVAGAAAVTEKPNNALTSAHRQGTESDDGTASNTRKRKAEDNTDLKQTIETRSRRAGMNQQPVSEGAKAAALPSVKGSSESTLSAFTAILSNSDFGDKQPTGTVTHSVSSDQLASVTTLTSNADAVESNQPTNTVTASYNNNGQMTNTAAHTSNTAAVERNQPLNKDTLSNEDHEEGFQPIKSPNPKTLRIDDDGAGERKNQYYKKSAEAVSLLSGTKELHGTASNGKQNTNVASPDPLNGCHCLPEEGIAVTFHVLVPVALWGWRPDTKLAIVFGDKTLGQWKTPVGQFSTRKLSGELMEAHCTIQIRASLLEGEKQLPYKYVVYSDDGVKLNYEYLLQEPSTELSVNRCLIVPVTVESGGSYEMFDTIIYPKLKPENFVKKAVKALKDWGLGSNDICQPESMRQQCLLAYLEETKCSFMRSCLPPSYSIQQMVDYIMNILKCLLMQRLSHGFKLDVCRDDSLAHFMLSDWIIPVLHTLKHTDISTAEKNGHKVAVGITLTCVVNEMAQLVRGKLTDFSPEFLSDLLETLKLMPDEKTKKCLDYDLVVRILPSTFKNKAAEAICALANQLIQTKDFDQAEWLYCLPLVHFLKQHSKPFASPEVPIEKLDEKCYFSAEPICERIASKEGFVARNYEKMKPLLHSDPLLQYTFITVCPMKDMVKLVGNLSPYLCVALLAKQLGKDTKKVLDRKLQYLVPMLEKVMEVLKTTALHTNLQYMFDAAYSLLIVLRKVLPEKGVNSELKALKAVVSLVFHCVLLSHSSASKENYLQVTEVTDKLQDYFENWIKSKFSYEKSGRSQAAKMYEEFQIWQDLSITQCSNDECKQVWHGIITNIVKTRVRKLSFENTIHLLCEIGSKENPPEFLVNIFTEAAFEVLDKVNETGWEIFEWLFPDAKKRKNTDHFGRVLIPLLKRKYPQGKDSLSFDELLDWNLWHCYIRVFGECGEMQDRSEDFALLCSFALSMFEDMWTKLYSGKITVIEMEKIAGKQHNFGLLCSAATTCTTADLKQQLAPDAIRTLLEQRKAELSAIRVHMYRLRNMCQFFSDAEDFQLLHKELTLEVDTESICSLCYTKDGDIMFNRFKSAIPLSEMLPKFALLFPNYLFCQLWREEIAAQKSISVAVVSEQIWPNAYSRIQELMDSLHKRTIKLSTVDGYLAVYESEADLDRIMRELHTALNGCLECEGDDKWIPAVVKNIAQYRTLKRYEKVAETFLSLKDKMNLTGDFKEVKTLAHKVNISMKGQMLRAVDSNLISAAEFLEKFVSDCQSSKMKCLESYVNCQDVVEWIRKETKDVGDLQSFVNVSLTTSAEEGALANDRLSTLSTVGTGYRSLIYDLKPNAGFSTLSKACNTIWEALKMNPDLPKLLEDCNRDLPWYTSVKALQGRVEVTSFELLKNIQTYGRYNIGLETSSLSNRISDAVHVDLDDRENLLAKKNFTLDELRDLESKLILITGSRAENRKEVDHFLDMLHSACHIADVLLSLQRAGNVKYFGWKMQFPCSASVVDELQAVVKDMENDMQRWKDDVKESREKFYELNNFTTAQLVLLRRELGKLKVDCKAQVSPRVMLLLQSISTELSDNTVKETMVNLLAERPLNEPGMKSKGLEDRFKEMGAHNVCIDQPLAQHMSDELSSEERNEYNTTQEPKHVHSMDTTKCEATLSVDQLSTKKKGIYIMLTSCYGFDSSLALEAIDKCGENQYAAEQWCNEHKLECVTNSGANDVGESSEESETESMETTDDGSVHRRGIEGLPIDQDLSTVMITIMKPINSSHPAVQELVGSGYSDAEATTTHSTTSLTANNDWDENKILTLSELGCYLRYLNPPVSLEGRPFPKQLKVGSPNLLITTPDNVLKTVLSLYFENPSLPLPTFEEVLICNEQTTEEEVILLWRRAVGDPSHKRLFCLIHAEKLSYQVCDSVLWALDELTQGKSGYRLVIVCSNEGEEKSHFTSKLHLYQQHYTPMQSVSSFQEYLKNKFLSSTQIPKHSRGVFASEVDDEKMCVRIIKSARSGMGKSLYVKKMAQKLEKLRGTGPYIITVPIHGPKVTPDHVLELLQSFLDSNVCNSAIIHFDISPKVLPFVDTMLFSLLILKGLCDSRGLVWRCRPTQLYAVEITVTAKMTNGSECCTRSLLDLLPTVNCVSPLEAQQLMINADQQVLQAPGKYLMDEDTFRSRTYQLVYQYLKRHTAKYNLDTFRFSGAVEGDKQECLHLLLKSCGVPNPSWLEIKHFVTFLNLQLDSCEKSVFCDDSLVGDLLKGLKSFVVKFMIRMSKDFATPSLQDEGNGEESGRSADDILQYYQIVPRQKWEQNPHPYIFFNQDRTSVSFVGFKANRHTGDLINPVDGTVIEKAMISPQLITELEQNRVNFNEDYTVWNQQKDLMVQKLGTVMGLDWLHDPDPSYVLTIDNLIKMLAIQMRFRCGIPVVIMGETGCGKTRLIRYMCDLASQGSGRKNMFILKVHGGTTDKDIKKVVHKASKQAIDNNAHHLDTVVFFDEANTTDAIGLIKEIMCDHRIDGTPISTDIKFIAACNPYRKHSAMMIKKLESAGLGFYIKSTETEDKLGKIPLRQLVYRVLDLPPSMRPLVYDFGQLNMGNEKDYVSQIVTNHFQQFKAMNLSQYISAVVNVLAQSQAYMRKREDECSFVSLRDVERCMCVFEYFLQRLDLFCDHMNKKAQEEEKEPLLDPVSRSLVLALSICYHARLQDREDYEETIAKTFSSPLALPGGTQQFRDEVKWCQEVLLDAMELGPNTARNSALRENVFMMAVCMELCIPLFVVGKPGSSKSLAKSIVSTSMQGKASKCSLLQHFKQVHVFSYQCSQLSTPDSVIEVFNTAKHFQVNRNVDEFVSVVVLDEVGLAEDSPNLPLKALHPLLEDGTEGADDSDEILAREKRVAFIGISNWALDPAKMNRGVLLTRGEPSHEELKLSARGICSNKKDDPIREKLDGLFDPLAEAYHAICSRQKKDFFGLRDFYSLIKMLYWICEKSTTRPLNWQALEYAIRRNFSGLDEFDPFDEFRKRISLPSDATIDYFQLTGASTGPSQLDLIKASLRTRDTSWHGESRYLLFLTENYSALRILHHYLQDVIRISPVDLKDEQPMETSSGSEFSVAHMEPFVLFGSSFPKDKEYTQVCRNINQIKICMETGRSVILLNLESLYESLYDVLNQYYIEHGGNRYVDLGLQTHRVKCRVHENFKLILIAERATVYEKFPTPLINRLEKHFVLTKSVLTDWQHAVLEDFENWIEMFCSIMDCNRNYTFKKKDAFVGYQRDTPAAVVFQATHYIQQLQNELQSESIKESLTLHLAGISINRFVNEAEGSELWRQAVLMQCKCSLLQTASPDALIRLKSSTEIPKKEVNYLNDVYFKHQHHSSLQDFLSHQFQNSTHLEGLLIQVTTHGHLMSSSEIEVVAKQLDMEPSQVFCFLLQDFDTELDFCNKISTSFNHERNDECNTLLIVQCESGDQCGDLIACARYRIYDERAKVLQTNSQAKGHTHVIFIIHLPPHTTGSSFIGYQGEPWISIHIDDLCISESDQLTLQDALSHKISELFSNSSSGRGQEQMEVEMCVQAATSKLQGSSTNKERALKRLSILLDVMQKDQDILLDDITFYGALVNHMHRILKKRDEIAELNNWVLSEALDLRRRQHSGTFCSSLTRKLDEVFIPIFAEVIAFCDQYCNLNLLHNQENDAITKFWISIFKHPDILVFNYYDITANHRSSLHLMNENAADYFECKLPFFWLIKDAIDGTLANITNYQRSNAKQLLKEASSLISQTCLGDVLGSVVEADLDRLYDCYLQDFVRSAHRCYHKDPNLSPNEITFVSNALSQLACSAQFCSVDGHQTLIDKICSLHVVYNMHKRELLWFGQLTMHCPDILVSLSPSNITDTMTLHLSAVEKALEILEPPILEDEAVLQLWMRRVKQCRNAIDCILLLPSTSKAFARKTWQLVLVLTLFAEHIMLKHRDTVCYARRLHLLFKNYVNFQEPESVEKLQKFLNSIDSDYKKILNRSELKTFRQHSHLFFIEVVSALCFGFGAPEDRLIEMLIDTVFLESSNAQIITKDLTPYIRAKPDTVPVIRSFLLKLLIDHSDQAKLHLQSYFHKSQQTMSGVDQMLCLLCVQCFEDAAHKKWPIQRLKEGTDQDISKLLQQSFQAIQTVQHCDQGKFSIPYLEDIGHLRYGLSVVATVLHSEVTAAQESITAPNLLRVAREICADDNINVISQSLCTGPAVFLVKTLVRQYGNSCLESVFVNHSWVVPDALQNKSKENWIDPFVVYGPEYTAVRAAVNDALYGDDFDKLHEAVKILNDYQVSYLLYSTFEIATMSRASTQPSKQLLPDAVAQFDKFIKDCHQLTNELNWMARTLLANTQGGPLEPLQAAPKQRPLERDICALMVHAAVVFITRKDTELLSPFVNMLNNPTALVNAYLPTMPDDQLPEVRTALSGTFYQCPRGHPYLVTECGRPQQVYTCAACGAAIGGTDHNLLTDNALARTSDETQTGHVLGLPDGRTSTHPERKLSPIACCIIRVLMHSALLWASCNNHNVSSGLVELIKPAMQESMVPEFIWRHLDKDISLLAKSLGKSTDESLLAIHMILRGIAQKDIPKDATDQTVSALQSRSSREHWESRFNQLYIQPFLQEMDQRLESAMHAIHNNTNKEIDRLFYTVYERTKLSTDSIEPHLWVYRERICLEHLDHILLTSNAHQKYPLLYTFLQEEQNLRATQYLPDIVYLQHYLYEKCNARLDRKGAKMAIRDLIMKESESACVELQKAIVSLSKAWELVHERLTEHARLRVDQKYLIPTISLDTKVECLLPTTVGPGVCTSSLVDYLVCVHNDFVEKCREASNPKWICQKIPITHINTCHVMDYEVHLLPLILSHCHYSLTYGQGQEVKYDFAALEKHIVDRFIYGKPHIMLMIPTVVFKEDRFTAATFGAIRRNVAQESLSQDRQEQIIAEWSQTHKYTLKDALDAVEIIIRFLSSGGSSKSEKSLGEYAEKALKMDKHFCAVTHIYCKLKHVVSLWQTVSVQLARMLTLKGQEPFDQLDLQFLEKLTIDQESALTKMLRSCNLGQLLGILFEFIETFLRHSLSNLQWSLVETLEPFLEGHGISETRLLGELGTVRATNSQAVAVWKYVVIYQDKQKKGTSF